MTLARSSASVADALTRSNLRAAGVGALVLLLCSQAIADPEGESADDPAVTAVTDPVDAPASDDGKAGWAVLPGISYSPDDGLKLAGTALVYSRTSAANRRASQLATSLELSVRGDRELVLAPNIWLRDARVNIAFKLRANQITRAYFGIGNDTPVSAREDYTSTRMGLRGHVNYRLVDDLFLGIVYDFQHQNLTEFEPGKSIERFVRDQGPTTLDSGVGVELRHDSRDAVYWPTRGSKALIRARVYTPALASDTSFVAVYTQNTMYLQVHPAHVLAGELQAEFRSTGARFDALALAGGDRLLRGMLRGRYRDHLFIGGQIEYRYPLWWRFGGVVFMGLGQVAPGIDTLGLDGFKYSVGAGLRARLNDAGVRVRADVGFSDGDSGLYLNLLEAF